MRLIGGAISQAFIHRAARAKIEGKLDSLVFKLLQRLMILGFFPFLIISIIGKDVYTVIFGNQWGEAGIYTQLLSLWAFVWFISSPLSNIYAVLEKQPNELLMHSLIFLSRILTISIGAYFGSPIVAIFLFGLGGIFSYGYLLISIIKLCNVSLKEVFSENIKFILNSIIFVVPLIVFKLIGFNELNIVLLAIITISIYVFVFRRLFFGLFTKDNLNSQSLKGV